jgi:hypothetical protein
VGRLVDAFLIEVSKDPNLPVDKLLAIAEAVPDSARPEHDGLYKVVDSYLKVKNSSFHSSISLCRRLAVTSNSKVGVYMYKQELFLRINILVHYFTHRRTRR